MTWRPTSTTNWLELERIHVRSRFVRAACRAGELLVAIGKPSEAIDAVRPALDADPYHERSYLALADAYRALDDHSSARAILRRAEETCRVWSTNCRHAVGHEYPLLSTQSSRLPLPTRVT